MGETLNSSAPGKPSSRAFSVIGLMLIVQAIFVLHSSLAAHEVWRVAYYVMLSPLGVWIWALHTIKCLRDLRLSGLWLMSIAVPIASVAFCLFEGWRITSLVSLAVALAVQLVFAFMEPSREFRASDSVVTGGPSA
jgi:uncharacterized membrane protein YhaH (DUF805 family)